MPLFENIFQPKTKKLLDHRKPGKSQYPADWQERAVRTLIKLLTKHSAIEDLEKAVVAVQDNVSQSLSTIYSKLSVPPQVRSPRAGISALLSVGLHPPVNPNPAIQVS